MLKLCLLLLAGLAAADLWIWFELTSARSSAVAATSNRAYCQQLATRIRGLREAPAVAQSQAIAASELVRRIERAMASAELAPDRLGSVLPEAPKRVEDSPYVERPTNLQIRSVSLRQLVSFLHAVTSDSGLRITSIRLAEPREETAVDAWNADVTVSYWVYSPKAGGGGAT
jgi:hypothetical protein